MSRSPKLVSEVNEGSCPKSSAKNGSSAITEPGGACNVGRATSSSTSDAGAGPEFLRLGKHCGEAIERSPPVRRPRARFRPRNRIPISGALPHAIKRPITDAGCGIRLGGGPSISRPFRNTVVLPSLLLLRTGDVTSTPTVNHGQRRTIIGG